MRRYDLRTHDGQILLLSYIYGSALKSTSPNAVDGYVQLGLLIGDSSAVGKVFPNDMLEARLNGYIGNDLLQEACCDVSQLFFGCGH